MADQDTLLSRYFLLIHDLIINEDLRSKAMRNEGARKEIAEARRIPHTERGELGFEFVKYTEGGPLDLFSILTLQYACFELSGLAHIGNVERGARMVVETSFFKLLSDLAKNGDLWREFDEIRYDSVRLGKFLDKHLPIELGNSNSSFSIAVTVLLGELRDPEPLARTINTFVRDYAQKFHAPC